MSKSLSITEFCQLEGISRAFWYLLKARGEAPETYNVGKLVKISPEAHAAWRAAREAASREVAA